MTLSQRCRFEVFVWPTMKAVLTLIFMVVMFPGCQQQPMKPVQPAQDAGSRDLSIVISGDTRGWLMPCGCTSNQSGGLLRRATYFEQIRDKSDVVVLDCGGAADGTAPYQQARFKAILMGEKLMKLAVHNIGVSEAAFGAEILKQLSAETGIEFISANIRQNDTSFTATHKLVLQSGHRLLITGVCSQKLIAEAENIPAGIGVSDPADAILSVIEEVRQPDAIVLVLAWLPEDEMRQLAESLPEIHILVGGPTGQSVPPQIVGRTLIMSATNKGKFIAHIPMPQNHEPLVTAEIVELSPSFADNADQKLNLESFRSMLAARDFTAAESGFIPTSIAIGAAEQLIAGTDSCRECHTNSCSVWDKSGHSHAWARLESEKGQVDPYCQQCHTTGYGLPSGFISLKESGARTNVGCESCHGPSTQHVRENRTSTPFDAKGSCTHCHDHENSPHFSFTEYWEKILHE